MNFLGLASTNDHDLMPRIIAGEFVFVTNNAADFRRLYRNEPLHAGLVIIVPQVRPALQGALLDVVLGDLEVRGGLINEVLEVLLEGDEVVINRYAWPED